MWEVRFSSQLRYRISGWLHGPVQRHRGEPGHTVRCKEGSMDTQNSHLPPIVYSRCLDNFHIWKSDHAYYIIGPPVRATTGFALERDGFIKTLTLSLLRIRVLQPH